MGCGSVSIDDSQLDDLRGEFRGRLAVDLATRSIHASDASPFSAVPMAVACPLDEADLRTLVRFAYERSLPLIPRGAGTGFAGESLGSGISVDLATHFRKPLEFSSRVVRASAGITWAELTDALAARGERIGPDPYAENRCTVGGLIGTNGSGPNVTKHGTMRTWVRRLRVIWDDGDAAELGAMKPVRSPDAVPEYRTVEIRAQLAPLLGEHRELIQSRRPSAAVSRAGYALHDVVGPAGLDLTSVLVGSEGTLGLVTEVEFATQPLPFGRSRMALGFTNLAEALRAGLLMRTAPGLTSCVVSDQRLLALARRNRPAEATDVPEAIVALMIAEFESERDGPTANALAFSAFASLQATLSPAPLAGPNDGPGLMALARHLTRTMAASGPGNSRPVPIIEDTAVPCEELLRYAGGLAEIVRRSELTGPMQIHPQTGHVDLRPLFDPASESDRAKLWPLADRVHALACALGGTVSTRHGVGIARTPWMAKQFGDLLPVFAEVKRIFDPRGILNPGKIVNPDPSRPAWPFPDAARTARSPLLVWSDVTPSEVAGRCTGCGECRQTSGPGRMCPTFRAGGGEAAAPRAKRVLERLLESPDGLATMEAELREIAGWCVNCKMCRTECPSRVDVPKLVLEAKARLHAEAGLSRDEWMLAHIGGLIRFGSFFATTSNVLLGRRTVRWVVEKLFGLSRKRLLPKLVQRTFLQRAKSKGWCDRDRPAATRGPASQLKVAYFVDLFANHADPWIGEAAVEVLLHHGIRAYVPPRQRGSGVAALAHGDLDAAKVVARHNVRLLAELVRDGYVVVSSDPTAVATIVQDYPNLFDDEDTRLVAEHTQELTQFLWKLHGAGRLRPFPTERSWRIGHHVPCHIKALGEEPAGPKLLRLIPGTSVETIDRSCSGMAGTFGLSTAGYDLSMVAGRAMLEAVKSADIRTGSTECGSCRMQMQDGARKRTLHPVQYMALAYGLLPKFEKRLTKSLGKLNTD